MNNWHVLILSGPMGAGKASVGQQVCQAIPGTQFLQVYRSRTATLSLDADSPRDAALAAVRRCVEAGQRVVFDDVIDTLPDLVAVIDALAGLTVQAVTLMPGLEEMERRDALKPIGQQAGSKLPEVYQTMAQRLAERSTVLDTADDTVEDTVNRILALLK